LIVVVDLSGLSAQAVFLIGSLLINRFARYLFSHFNRELPISLVADEAASLLEYSGMARDFEDFQSRARAFKLWLLVVHQTMHQLDPKLRQAMWSLGSQYIMRLLNIEDAQEAVSNLLDFAPEKAKIPEGAEKPTGMTPLEQTRFDANALQKAKNREGIYRRPVLKRNWRLQTNEVVWQTTWEKVPYIHLGDVSESMIEEVKQRSLQTFARPKAQVLREIESRMEKAMALPIADRKQRRREKA
jgi:hypothetical protein